MMWPDNCDTLEIPCTNFYSTYQNWCSENGENKTLSDNKFGMEIKQFIPKTRPRRSDVQDVQEAPVEEVELVAEKPAEKKPEPVEEKPAPVIRKTPPPLPPKPDHLKNVHKSQGKKTRLPPEPDNYDVLDDLLSDSDSTTANPVPEKPSAPEPDNYDILYDLLSDSDSTTMDPTPEQQSESPAESSASVTKPDPELASEVQFIPVTRHTKSLTGSRTKGRHLSRTGLGAEKRHRWDRKPWVKNLKDQVFNDLYNTGKELWAKYQDASDEYDWEILAFEIEECPTTRIEDEYQYYLMEVVDRFKDWIEYNGYLPKIPSRKELADLIRIYKENRNAEIIPTPSGYETMRADKGKVREIPEERPKTDMEREWEAANGIIDDWDEEDTEGAINDIL
ncbi:uncharacterized protein OCT59_010031 [Rhizophagus irregularis]|uniref:uncharacterized protein n=1 Tax=Rhizophagus irregularis TaxID=588596 RepID=UPI00331B55DC|nr:hypothetical protein OCT59_010031 [Rhizophagus irregularis]